eukprot:5826750-Pyramimonas_sp.AAC.1
MADPKMMDEDGHLIGAGTHCNLFVKLRSGTALADPQGGVKNDRSEAGQAARKMRDGKIRHFKNTNVWP